MRCSSRNRARRLRAIEYLGFTDAFRACHAETHQYTFWDYQAGAWAKDHGIRIDHILLVAAGRRPPEGLRHRQDRCAAREKPSDHVPVWCELKL